MNRASEAGSLFLSHLLKTRRQSPQLSSRIFNLLLGFLAPGNISKDDAKDCAVIPSRFGDAGLGGKLRTVLASTKNLARFTHASGVISACGEIANVFLEHFIEALREEETEGTAQHFR